MLPRNAAGLLIYPDVNVECSMYFCYLQMVKDKMLTARETADILRLPIVKILRWVHQGKIPCKFKEGVCYFREEDVRSWAEEHHFILPEAEKTVPESGEPTGSLSRAVARGGIHTGLPGSDIYALFSNAVKRMPFLEGHRETALEALLDREEIASTGIGRGVAIPHPRRVLALGLEDPVIPVFFCKKPVDFGAVDGHPVFVLFFMFSSSTSVHLDLLSRLSYCLRSPRCLEVLKNPGDGIPVLKTIREIEARIQKN